MLRNSRYLNPKLSLCCNFIGYKNNGGSCGFKLRGREAKKGYECYVRGIKGLFAGILRDKTIDDK